MPRYFLLYPCEAYPSGQMFLSRCCVRKLEYRFPEIVLLLRFAESFSNSSLKFLVKWCDHRCMGTSSDRFFLVEPHHHALAVNISVCEI